jgi:adenylate cyclase class IV
MSKIEIEFRSIVTKEEYDNLLTFLTNEGKDLGEDDKDSSFYLLENKLLKVVENVSKGNAKVCLKLQEVGEGSGKEEFEYPIAKEYVEIAKDVFDNLGFTERIDSFQKRHNFVYKEIEFAIKYSDDWSYHVEMEILIENEAERLGAESHIKTVAKELGIQLMTDEEQKSLVEKIKAEKNL